jgi:hypothetical protein
LNVRIEVLDFKGIPKVCRAAASGEKNNSLFEVSLMINWGKKFNVMGM